jgi:hypothetical protein
MMQSHGLLLESLDNKLHQIKHLLLSEYRLLEEAGELEEDQLQQEGELVEDEARLQLR